MPTCDLPKATVYVLCILYVHIFKLYCVRLQVCRGDRVFVRKEIERILS
jgi:hypothetical protein